jgi:hypothetical protein
MSSLEIAYAILIIACILTTVYVLISFKRRKQYTREKFAFRVFLMISSLSSTFLTVLFTGHTATSSLISKFQRVFGIDSTPYEASISDKILALAVIGSLIFLALRLHRNWQGPISTREHDIRVSGIKPKVIRDTVAAIRDYTGQVPLRVYQYRSSRSEYDDSVDLPPNEAKAWHIWAARALVLSRRQIHIDEVKDWYPDRYLYIGKYGSKDSTIGVMCVDDIPSANQLETQISFIAHEVALPSQLIVAINRDGQQDDCSALSVPVQFRFRDQIISELVDFSGYKSYIRARYEVTPVAEGYALKLPDIYVESAADVKEEQGFLHVENVEEYISQWASENSSRHLAVLGEYGQGKSVLALRITYRMLFEENSARIPILITLGGRSPRTQSPLGLLAEWAAPLGINPSGLMALHELGRLLLIFDAFDEMDLVGEASLRLDHFRRLWEFSRDRGAKILITGRPNFFLDQFEREAALNIRAASAEIPFTVPLYLSRFDPTRTARALRSFKPEIGRQIREFLSSRNAPESFKDLVSRPSTLFLVANIWEKVTTQGNLEKLKSAEVISSFITHSYDRQLAKPEAPAFLSLTEREYFNAGIAIGMRKEAQLSNHLNQDQLRSLIKALLESYPEELERFETAANRKRPKLKDRLQNKERLLETIGNDIRSCGILVTDLSQIDALKFAHKSFFELIVAQQEALRLLECSSPSKELIINRAVWQALLASGSRVFGPMNEEMRRFAGEILYVYVSKGGVDLDEKAPKLSYQISVRINTLRVISSLWANPLLWPFAQYLDVLLSPSTSYNVYFILGYYDRARSRESEFVKLLTHRHGPLARFT